MRDRRDQVGAVALLAGALDRVAEGHGERGDAAVLGTGVGGRDEQFEAVGEVQRALGMPGAGGQAAVRVEAAPPVAALGVEQRQDLGEVAAERVRPRDAGQAFGRAVEHDHAALGVGHEQPVGQRVRAESGGGIARVGARSAHGRLNLPVSMMARTA